MLSSSGSSQPRDCPDLPHCRWILYCLNCGDMSAVIMGWRPLPFDCQAAFLHICRQGHLPWPRECSSYLFTSVELSFSLECLGENKPSFYSTWQTPAVWTRGPSISYPRQISLQPLLESQGHELLTLQLCLFHCFKVCVLSGQTSVAL